MADAADTQRQRPPVEKLPPVPKGARLQKRPLTRRQQPSVPNRIIVYVSSSTSLMAAVRRARKLLDRGLRGAAAAPKQASLHARVAALQRDPGGGGGGMAVTLVGSGRAVEKTLAVAAWFERSGDCDVRLRTGTVGAVDDVIVEGEGDDESRVRKLSCLEVVVSLK